MPNGGVEAFLDTEAKCGGARKRGRAGARANTSGVRRNKGKEPATKRGRPEARNAGGSEDLSADKPDDGRSMDEVPAGVDDGAGSVRSSTTSDVPAGLGFDRWKTLSNQTLQRFNYDPWDQ